MSIAESKDEVALRKEEELRRGPLCRGISQVDLLAEESGRRNSVVERNLSEASERLPAVQEPSEDAPGKADDPNEEVAADHIRGVQHVAKMTELVSLQQATYNRVMAMSSKRDDDPREADHHRTDTQSSPNLHKMRPYLIEDMKSSKKGIFNSSRMLNGCDVGNKKATEKARQERFQRRRRQCMNEELKKNEELERAHEAADQCVVKCQHELVEKQTMIVNAAQQKRNEQQKVVNENLKNEMVEYRRLKAHSDEKKEPSVEKASESLCRGIQQVSRISPEAAAEPVYREMLESHSIYDSTLTKWSNFVKENEHRSEVYRLKFVGDESKKKKDRSSSKGSLFRKTVDKVNSTSTSLRKLFSKSASNIDLDIQADTYIAQAGSAGEALSHSELAGCGRSRPVAIENEWMEEGLSNSLMSSHLVTSTMSSPSSPSVYAARLERVKSHHLDMEDKARSKLESDKKFLEEKRQKGKGEVNKKAAKAKDYNNAWEERNDDYGERRVNLNASSDVGHLQKMANQKLDGELQAAAQDKDLFETSRNRELKRELTKDTAQRRLWATVEGFKDKHEDRDIRSTGFKDKRIELANHRATQNGLEERAEDMIAFKHAEAQAFSKKAMQDIERKHKRNDKAKSLLIRPVSLITPNPDQAFARLRLCKADGGSSPKRDRPHTSPVVLVPGWSMPDDCKESPEGWNRLFSESLGQAFHASQASDEVSPYHDASPPRTPAKVRKASKTSSVQSPTPSRPTAGGLLSPGTPGEFAMSLFKPSPGSDSRQPSKCMSQSSKQREPSPDSDNDGDGGDSEANFLEDLESSAQRWLGGLKRDK